jgi:hypothetical protein
VNRLNTATVRHITDYLTSREILMANINEEITNKDVDLELKLDEDGEPIIVEPELDGDGNQVVVETEPELDDDGNPIVDVTPEWGKKNAEMEENDVVPVGTLTHERKKYRKQALQKDEEIEQLKSELAAKNSPIPAALDSKPLIRPRERDFETDEELDAANDKYDAQLRASIISEATKTNTQTNQQEKLQRDIGTSVDSHDIRVEEFIKQQKIDPTVYNKADSNLRKAVDDIRPQFGDIIVDEMIHRLGKGSEKVMLYIGNNKDRLDETISSMVKDPSGSDTLVLLGRYQAEVKPLKKQTSQARKPAAHVNGGVTSSSKGKAEKKLFDAAKTPQDAIVIRRAAKDNGIDVTEWG